MMDFGVGWSAAFLNEVFLPEPPEGDIGRRLYVRRGAAKRAVLNEDDVLAMLEPRGFEAVVMDDRSVSEQAGIFASASVIVAPHGAALANLVFRARVPPSSSSWGTTPPAFCTPCSRGVAASTTG